MYQLAVLDAMRLVGVLSQAALLVGLVIGEGALEPHRLGIALEREDMGNDAVEEPAIVRDDDRAAAEVEQRLSSSARRVSTSRSLVGSSSSSRLPPLFKESFARCTQLRSPPERSATRSAGPRP